MVPEGKDKGWNRPLRFRDEPSPRHQRRAGGFTPELVLAYREALDETTRLQHETLRRGRPQLHLVVDQPRPRLRADILEGYARSLIGRAMVGLCMSLGIVAAVLAWRAFVMSLQAL